jgi:hypothetical protein
VANVRLRSRSFSNEAKKLSFAALSCGLPLRLLDCVIPSSCGTSSLGTCPGASSPSVSVLLSRPGKVDPGLIGP